MSITSKQKHNYIKEIRRFLLCNRKRKREFLSSFTDSMETYISENPNATCDEMVMRFGTPQEIAESFLENESPIRIRKKVTAKRIVIVGIAAVIVMIAVTLAVELSSDYRATNGYFEETITTLKES